MSKFSQIFKIVVILAAVVGAGALLGWLGSRARSHAKPPGIQEPVTLTSRPASGPGESPARPAAKPLATGTNEGIAAPGATNLITDWEDRIDVILSSPGEDADKAKQMLAMFPRLPEDGQVEVAQHMANLTPDEDFGPLGKYLTTPGVSEDVLDVIMADLLNRPNTVKLPLLLEVARDNGNPKAAEAKDLLELFLEEDYGSDWNTWQAKVDQWLKDNPD